MSKKLNVTQDEDPRFVNVRIRMEVDGPVEEENLFEAEGDAVDSLLIIFCAGVLNKAGLLPDQAAEEMIATLTVAQVRHE